MKGSSIFNMTVSSVAIALLASCASAPKPEPVVIDWTNRACESPAYKSILGNYSGQINYRDSEARACRWNAEISIIGVSMVSECRLTGTIVATPEFEGTDGYMCNNLEADTKFVVGLSDTDLNQFGPSSVIVHLEQELQSINSNGTSVLNPFVQYESLTAENNALITDAGNILNRL